MSLIIATHWARSPYERCLEVKETRQFGTRKAAEMWANSVLPPVVTTNDCYWRDIGMSGSVTLYPSSPRSMRNNPRRRSGFWARNPPMTVEAEVVIVPSVGELGWTP
jgi:hypothetical protein